MDEINILKKEMKNFLPELINFKKKLLDRLEDEGLKNICFVLKNTDNHLERNNPLFYLFALISNGEFYSMANFMNHEENKVYYHIIRSGIKTKGCSKEEFEEFSLYFIEYIILELMTEFKSYCKILQLKKIKNSIDDLTEKIDHLIEEFKYSPNNTGRMIERSNEFHNKSLTQIK